MKTKKQIFQVRLKEMMPLLYKGRETWYEPGQLLDVVEVVEMPIVGKCYKLSYQGFAFDGVTVADAVEVCDGN